VSFFHLANSLKKEELKEMVEAASVLVNSKRGNYDSDQSMPYLRDTDSPTSSDGLIALGAKPRISRFLYKDESESEAEEEEEYFFEKKTMKRKEQTDYESKKKQAKKTDRQCSYCGTTETPMWRHGPPSHSDLCNKCGMKYMRKRILQDV
jgi:hypothetical protein